MGWVVEKAERPKSSYRVPYPAAVYLSSQILVLAECHGWAQA